ASQRDWSTCPGITRDSKGDPFATPATQPSVSKTSSACRLESEARFEVAEKGSLLGDDGEAASHQTSSDQSALWRPLCGRACTGEAASAAVDGAVYLRRESRG
ncbi:unnamed protein product, partial [Pylaiella littoralis]